MPVLASCRADFFHLAVQIQRSEDPGIRRHAFRSGSLARGFLVSIGNERHAFQERVIKVRAVGRLHEDTGEDVMGGPGHGGKRGIQRGAWRIPVEDIAGAGVEDRVNRVMDSQQPDGLDSADRGMVGTDPLEIAVGHVLPGQNHGIEGGMGQVERHGGDKTGKLRCGKMHVIGNVEDGLCLAAGMV